MKSISDIKHTFYINLKHRKDRKMHVENQLNRIGIQKGVERFEAIKLNNGAIGCSMSHLKCLEIAKKRNYEHVLIVEDDITFLNPELFNHQINMFFNKHSHFDVLLFAGNNIPPYIPIDESCVKVLTCQTTTGYLVKNSYFDTLIQNFKQGLTLLMHNPTQHMYYAIDKYWFSLQQKDNWYLIIPLTVTQREDYSDIEKTVKNYTDIMIDLDKEKFKTKILNNTLNNVIPLKKSSLQITMKI
jgi:GR25 family glycosyltransferase involved in LPS biosynthesis